ncbi:MAG: hypothetical protein D6702_06600 [Planctomycetota bacterium]|nr:MAG: hypothetical protein D6702_06600 [Planctomycetota bacterium]
MGLKHVAALAVAVLAGAASVGPARPPADQDGAEAGRWVCLAVRLEPGRIWRQEVGFSTTVSGSDGKPALWTFDYRLRLQCRERLAEGWAVEARFIDWRLRLEKGGCGYSWQDGRFLYLGGGAGGDPAAGEDEGHPSCRDLLAAWSNGLRKTVLRFRLLPDGRVEDLSGLERLHEEVADALASAEALPAEIRLFFGPEGLDRADHALALALSVPRPTGRVEPGASWEHRSDLHGLLPEPLEIRRRFRLAGLDRERRFSLALVEIDPAWDRRLPDGGWQTMPPAAEAAAEPESIEILTDCGLVYRMEAGLALDLPGDRHASFRLRSRLAD